MNEKCKYCDYVSKCSKKCEYDSIICKVQISFPKVVDKSYEQLQQKNEELKERITYLEHSNNRREDIISEQRQEINNLEDNWNKLKDYVVIEWYSHDNDSIEFKVADDILDKIKELKGSDE